MPTCSWKAALNGSIVDFPERIWKIFYVGVRPFDLPMSKEDIE
jgi:hypothetical protein